MENNTGGISEILEYVSVNEVDTFNLNKSQYTAYITHVDMHPKILNFTKDTLEYSCELQEDEFNGNYYEVQISGSIPKLSTHSALALDSLKNGRFLVFPKFKNGTVKIMGSIEHPCRIEVREEVSADISTNSYKVTFRCVSLHLPYFRRFTY